MSQPFEVEPPRIDTDVELLIALGSVFIYASYLFEKVVISQMQNETLKTLMRIHVIIAPPLGLTIIDLATTGAVHWYDLAPSIPVAIGIYLGRSNTKKEN